MPAISSRFNRYLWILAVTLAFTPGAYGQLPALSQADKEWLGERIFQNECAGRFACLTSWNEGEDFPSLGIGHFIWYQAGQIEPFEETFPELLEFYRQRRQALPAWLSDSSTVASPWRSRDEFYLQIDSPPMQELREFLAASKAVQVEYISERLHRSVSGIIGQFAEAAQPKVADQLYQIANSAPPLGLYALIDYIHFKGTGLSTSERYQNQGWGLLQVMEQLQNSHATLENFVQAAELVLERRVINAPPGRDEQRWLAGWKNRLRTYLPGA